MQCAWPCAKYVIVSLPLYDVTLFPIPILVLLQTGKKWKKQMSRFLNCCNGVNENNACRMYLFTLRICIRTEIYRVCHGFILMKWNYYFLSHLKANYIFWASFGINKKMSYFLDQTNGNLKFSKSPKRFYDDNF